MLDISLELISFKGCVWLLKLNWIGQRFYGFLVSITSTRSSSWFQSVWNSCHLQLNTQICARCSSSRCSEDASELRLPFVAQCSGMVSSAWKLAKNQVSAFSCDRFAIFAQPESSLLFSALFFGGKEGCKATKSAALCKSICVRRFLKLFRRLESAFPFPFLLMSYSLKIVDLRQIRLMFSKSGSQLHLMNDTNFLLFSCALNAIS